MRLTAPRLFLVTWVAAALLGCSQKSDQDLIASAQGYLGKKDVAAATIQLKSALQVNPQSAQARFLLGKTLLMSGDAVGALVELNKARELGHPADAIAPELARALLANRQADKVIADFGTVTLKEPLANADLLSTLAMAYAARNDLASAKQLADRALQAQPLFAPAVLLQARLAAGAGDIAAAKAQIDELLAKEPKHEVAALMRANLLAASGDRDAALAALRDLLAVNPRSVPAHVATIGLLRQAGQPDAAKSQLAELKKFAANHPDALYLDARQQLQEGNYAGARDIAEQLLKAAPENPDVLFLAGVTESRLGGVGRAEAHLAKAVAIAPGFGAARQHLAEVRLRAGDASRALEVLGPLVGSERADGRSLALAGEAQLALGDSRKADEFFRRASAASPDDPKVRTSVALGRLARGDTGAVGDLEQIAAGDGGTRADLAVVSARLRANDTAGALKAVEGLQRKLPDRPLPDLLRGRILQAGGDTAGALAAYEAAIKKEATFFPAVAAAAAVELGQGKPELARQRFEALLAARPASYQAHLALAELDQRAGATPATIGERVAQAVKAAPNENRPRLVMIEHLLRSGDARAALSAAQEAVAALPDDVALQEALGRAQLAAGSHEQAMVTFGRLANRQARDPMAQLRLAEAHLAARDPAGARRALEKALQIQPGFVPAQRGLATVALSEGRDDEALAIARQVQKADPKQPAGFALESDIHRQRKDWPAAIAAARQVLALARGPEAAIRLHQLQVQAGATADADRLAADWMRDNPGDAAFRFYLGDAAIARKDWPAAEGHYRGVLQKQPDNALALNNVAWLMAQQGKPGAVPMAERAVQLQPGRPQLLDTLATALAADNQVARALETQKQALARAPQDPNLRLNLARLYLKADDQAGARAELDTLAKLGDRFAGQAEVTALRSQLR